MSERAEPRTSAGVPEVEIPLSGGNSNAPVRTGDRVRRTAGPWSPAVHAVLRHLRSAGLTMVPEPFGFDAEGREVLEYLPGDVPAYPLPPIVWSDTFLVEATRLLRRLHDASASFDASGCTWQQPVREPQEVVSLNDFAPYNLVLQEGRITGVIDLDQMSPGPRARDLAHLAYRLVPLTAPENQDGIASRSDERDRRLRLLADVYGAVDVEQLRDAVPPLLDDIAAHADGAGRPDHGDLYRRDAAWLRGPGAGERHPAG